MTADFEKARSFILCVRKHQQTYSKGSTSLKSPFLVSGPALVSARPD